MKNFEDKVVQITSKLTCDGCGEQAAPNDFEFHEFISVNHQCGYGSKHGDGNLLNIDLCQQCLANMCGDSLRITEANTKHYSDSRIDVKDILLANKISNKRELNAALKRLDQLWDAQNLSSIGSELYQLVDLIHSYEGKSWDSYFNEVASDDFMAEREEIIKQNGAASGLLSDINLNKGVSDDESLQDSIDEYARIKQVLPEAKMEIIEILARIWTKYPDLRLSQLIVNAIPLKYSLSELFYIEDSILLNKLKTFRK